LAEQQQQQQQQVTFMQKLQAERRRRLLEYQQRKRLEAANGSCTATFRSRSQLGLILAPVIQLIMCFLYE